MTPRICAIVPVYNHGQTVGRVLARLASAGLDCIVVDDGSEPGCAATLDALAGAPPVVSLVRLPGNSGKGVAVQAGFREAVVRGYSHALQVDADAQHDLSAVPRFLAEARAHPAAVICAIAQFGSDIPRLRYYARYLTHVWVWINTLSLAIPDSMCGFRLYPLAAVMRLMARRPFGARMSFDTDILVRLCWEGLELRWLAVAVVYAPGGISHFRPVADNVEISLMHARLFFGMLWRAPGLIWRKLGPRAR